MYYCPVPETADEPPPRKSLVKPEPWVPLPRSPLWTEQAIAAFDPTKASGIHVGVVQTDATCCTIA